MQAARSSTAAAPGSTPKGSSAPVAARASSPSHALSEGLRSPSQALDGGVRAEMERRFGHDFADVRVHAGPQAAASAQALDAEAYASGRDLVFGAGRYDPASRAGLRLLSHELAHVAHDAAATDRRPGIAPADSAAERAADAAADAALLDDTRVVPGALLRGAGPAWSVHRQPVVGTKKGKVEHTGEVGRAPGEVGVPYGTVEVRTGEEVELKGGTKLPNRIAIEYSGALSADMKWLQFVWFELVATTPKGVQRVAATVPTTSGTKPFTTDPTKPDWSVDAATTTSPFYEVGGRNLRTTSSTTIFDAPGGGSVTPLADAVYQSGIGATAVTFTAHFETYLIHGSTAEYVTSWQASTAFSQAGGKTTAAAIGYTVGTSGQVSGLPAARQTLLATAFPAFKSIK